MDATEAPRSGRHVPWARMLPVNGATYVMRHHCSDTITVSDIAWLVAEFAFDPPTWAILFESPTTDAKSLMAVQWLRAHGVRYPQAFYSWTPFPELEGAAARGFLSVVRYLHEDCGCFLSLSTLHGAVSSRYLPVIQYVWEAGRASGLYYSTGNTSRFDVNRERLELAATAAMGTAAMSGDLEIFRYLCEVAGARCSFQTVSTVLDFGHYHIFDYMYSSMPHLHEELRVNPMWPVPAAFGRLSIVKVLYESGVLDRVENAIDLAASAGCVDAVNYLHELAGNQTVATTKAMDAAAARGHLDVVRFLHENRTDGCTVTAMDEAAANNHLAVVKFLHEHRTEGCTRAATTDAACNGHLAMVKYLHECRTEGCNSDTVDVAAERGHWDVVVFLLWTKRVEFSDRTLSAAVDNGYLEVVKCLVEKVVPSEEDDTRIWCTVRRKRDTIKYLRGKGLLQLSPEAILSSIADDEMVEYVHDECVAHATGEERVDVLSRVLTLMARTNKLAQIQFLDSRRRPGEVFRSEAMNTAAAVGNIEIVRYLHSQPHHIGWTTEAMDTAAQNGHVAVVRFLHRARQEGCTTLAMDMAAASGDLETVTFLNENRSEGCTTAAIDLAAQNAHWNIVKYLHFHRSEGCTPGAITWAAKHNSLAMVQFFSEHVRIGCLRDALAATVGMESCRPQLRTFLQDSSHQCCCRSCAPVCLEVSYRERVGQET